MRERQTDRHRPAGRTARGRASVPRNAGPPQAPALTGGQLHGRDLAALLPSAPPFLAHAADSQGELLPSGSGVSICPARNSQRGIKVGNLKLADITFEMQTVSYGLGTNKPAINVALDPAEMTWNVPQSIKSLFLSQKLTVPIKFNT